MCYPYLNQKLYLFDIKSIYFSNLACRKIKVSDTQKTSPFFHTIHMLGRESHVVLISRIWTEIVYNLKGLLDSIKDNTQLAKHTRLEFHAI